MDFCLTCIDTLQIYRISSVVRWSFFLPKQSLFRKGKIGITVKILKIGTPEIITIIVLQLEQLDFTVQYCVQKMQTE